MILQVVNYHKTKTIHGPCLVYCFTVDILKANTLVPLKKMNRFCKTHRYRVYAWFILCLKHYRWFVCPFFTMANHHAIGGTYVFIFSNQLLPKGDNSAEDLESWEDLNLSEINLRQVCPDCCSGKKKPVLEWSPWNPPFFWGNVVVYLLGGGFKYFSFSPLFGEDEPILTNIFQRGWNHQQVFFNHQFSMAPPRNSRTLLIRVQKKPLFALVSGGSGWPVITIGIPSPKMWVKRWHSSGSKWLTPKKLPSFKVGPYDS